MYIEQRIEELEKVGTRSDKEKQKLIAFANGKTNDPFSVLENTLAWQHSSHARNVGRSRKCAAE